MAVIFVTKMENGEKATKGLCLKCARELGVPVDNIVGNVMNQFGISPDQLQNAEEELTAMMEQPINPPSDSDDTSDGGAPAIDLPKLFRDAGLMSKQEGAVTPHADAPSGEGKANKKKEKDAKKLKFLPLYSRNLTQYARDGRLDRIIGRESELMRVIQILCRRQKNNPCLIGEPGVGKTAIAEALAMRIVEGNVPYKLRGKEIYLLDMTALVAGTQFRGQFESRMKGLIEEVKRLGNIILVIRIILEICSSINPNIPWFTLEYSRSWNFRLRFWFRFWFRLRILTTRLLRIFRIDRIFCFRSPRLVWSRLYFRATCRHQQPQYQCKKKA